MVLMHQSQQEIPSGQANEPSKLADVGLVACLRSKKKRYQCPQTSDRSMQIGSTSGRFSETLPFRCCPPTLSVSLPFGEMKQLFSLVLACSHVPAQTRYWHSVFEKDLQAS
jgi:hypothetical protein